MQPLPSRRRIGIGIEISAFAASVFGFFALLNALLSPQVICGIICVSPPLLSGQFGLALLATGGVVFAATILLVPRIFDRPRARLGSGILFLGLASIALEADVSYLWAYSFYMPPDFPVGILIWMMIVVTFGGPVFSLSVVGARHWWVASGKAGGVREQSAHGGRNSALEAVVLMTVGSAAAVLDVFFAGCLGSGPCTPMPPMPLVYPLLSYAAGLGLAMASVWQPRA